MINWTNISAQSVLQRGNESHANSAGSTNISNKFRFQRLRMLQLIFCRQSVCTEVINRWIMWITNLIIFISIISAIYCSEDEVAKVEQVDEKNSTINYIKYTNNGFFGAQITNISNHQMPAKQDQQLLSQCGGLFRNLQNLIESPKFISPRPICNLRCEYQIVSPYICENEFHVQFLDFAIDSSPNCENDKVIINYSDVLCGKVVGVKKYRTLGGVLNITFSSRTWDLKLNRGFRLLITRLPCVEDSSENQTEIDSLEPPQNVTREDENRCFHVNSSYTVTNPSDGQGHTIYGVPAAYNRTISGRQDIPVLPLPTPFPPVFPPIQPPVLPPFPPILPPPFLPQCCRNVYNQPRFLLISQGFPAYLVRNNDCIFVIHRSSPNMCRLRIVFKYFLLDDPQPGQFGCVNNFIEIDGQRMCGCKTNFAYETQWGFEPKIIRMRTVPGSFSTAQGFVLDIIQEECPFKYQDNIEPLREKRHLIAKKLLLHSLLSANQPPQQDYDFYPAINQFKPDFDEKFKSKFFNPEPNYINNVCVMNHLVIFKMKLENLGVPKQYCLPFY